MSLRIRSVLVNGLPRAFRRNGWILMGVFLLFSLVQGGLVWMVATTALPLGTATPQVTGGPMPTPGSQLPPLVSASAVMMVTFAGGFLTVPVSVVAIRTLVSRFTDRIPEEFVFHRLGWATVNSFIGTWLISIVIGALTIGLFIPAGLGLFAVADRAMLIYLISTWTGRALLVGTSLVLLIPSAFLGVSLIFVGQEIAVKDKNVIDAIDGSWRLTRHNRLRLLALALLPYVLQIPFSFIIFQYLPPIPGQIVTVIESVILQIVILAIMARAYVQSCDDEWVPDDDVEITHTPLFQKVK